MTTGTTNSYGRILQLGKLGQLAKTWVVMVSCRQKAAPWLEDDEVDGMSGSLSGGCDTGTFMSA